MNNPNSSPLIVEAAGIGISIEECYVVYPDRDTLDFELVLADPGEDGHKAIDAHFPKLKWAMDLDELAALIENAKTFTRFGTGPYWFKKPRNYLFIAIKDGTPIEKFVVEGLSVSKTLARAAKLYPGCLFNLVGMVEQFEMAGDAFLDVLNGGFDFITLDLRTAGQ